MPISGQCCTTGYRQARFCEAPDLFADVWMTTTDAATVAGGGTYFYLCFDPATKYFFDPDDTPVSPLPSGATLYTVSDVCGYASDCSDGQCDPSCPESPPSFLTVVVNGAFDFGTAIPRETCDPGVVTIDCGLDVPPPLDSGPCSWRNVGALCIGGGVAGYNFGPPAGNAAHNARVLPVTNHLGRPGWGINFRFDTSAGTLDIQFAKGSCGCTCGFDVIGPYIWDSNSIPEGGDNSDVFVKVIETIGP